MALIYFIIISVHSSDNMFQLPEVSSLDVLKPDKLFRNIGCQLILLAF